MENLSKKIFWDLICVTFFEKLLSCCLTKARHQKSEKSVMRKNETGYNTMQRALIGHNLAAQATRSGIEIFRSSISLSPKVGYLPVTALINLSISVL